LVTNMISFNVGVEIGQFIALALILMAFNLWRSTGSFLRHARLSNMCLMCAGFLLMGYQISGFFLA
ncbi:MAG: HupE/UreJ family protein, partial [Gammaproteobacteria bacterium]